MTKLVSEMLDRGRLTGLAVRNADGDVETIVRFTASEVAMPGYVESVEKSYVGTGWTTERIWGSLKSIA